MKILRATVALLVVTLVVGGGIYLLGQRKNAEFLFPGAHVSLPTKVTASSLCPVEGCTSSSCHGAAPPPALAVGQTMACPKEDCSSRTCHAQEEIDSHYVSSGSSNVRWWFIGLSALAIMTVYVALSSK